MSLRDNKMAVLRQLGLESEPISLSNLLAKLGKGFRERSVRRWVVLLVQEGSVKKTGQKKDPGIWPSADQKSLVAMLAVALVLEI
jgi:hypothetical protein